jgi:hypothetical protein
MWLPMVTEDLWYSLIRKSPKNYEDREGAAFSYLLIKERGMYPLMDINRIH